MLNSYLAPAIAEAITIKRAHSVRRTGDRVCFSSVHSTECTGSLWPPSGPT